MKRYRLKKEAVPFFTERLATAIYDWDVWQKYNVDDKALEEVEDARIEYGVKTSKTSSDLCGWDENGTHMRFTVVFPSMKFREHDAFTKGKMVRELMNRFQREANSFLNEFYNGDLDKKEEN